MITSISQVEVISPAAFLSDGDSFNLVTCAEAERDKVWRALGGDKK